MVYSSNSIANGVVSALLVPPACANLAYSAWTLHDYRRRHKAQLQTQAKGKAKYPAFLRAMFVSANFCTCLMGMLSTGAPWIYVDDGIRLDPFHETSLQQYSFATRWCSFGSKFGTFLYGITKLFTYMFFFIKQRTVRPMSEPTWPEKIIFLMTLGIFVLSAFVLVIAEGDSNALDRTCQIYLPIWIQIVMLVSDTILSFGFLYLFIQPLRVTIRNNQQVRSTAETQPPATAKVASSDRISISVPSGNNSLEEVMRKNTYACVITVVVSFCSLVFMITAHTTDDPYLRKWVTPVGQADALFSVMALTHIMRKPAKSSRPETLPMVNAARTNTERMDKFGSAHGHGTRVHSLVAGAAQNVHSPASQSAAGGRRQHQASPSNDTRSPVAPHVSSSPSSSPRAAAAAAAATAAYHLPDHSPVSSTSDTKLTSSPAAGPIVALQVDDSSSEQRHNEVHVYVSPPGTVNSEE